MSAPHPLYRSLVRLYPSSFRGHYGDDLVQHFTDLVTDRGARAAWTRTGVDLIVTVPRYRLESIMNEQHSATSLNVAITLLAAGGVMSVLTGLYPGLVLLAGALALAVAQRSTLAGPSALPTRTVVAGGWERPRSSPWSSWPRSSAWSAQAKTDGRAGSRC